jgi:glucose-6-phosphate 1-epimerase
VFDKSKPISGGIPHCFPQFGPGAIQLHGFARNVDWSLAASKNDGGNPAISLLLTDTDYTRAMWPHSFKAVYTVRLEGETLHTLLEVTNTGDSEFDFTASLHSYFGIDDIETANVRGLQGLEYLDRVADAKHPSVHKELRELVTFRGPVDSVYKSAPSKVTLDTRSGDVAIASNGWPEVVVWTPWTAMEACYREFVCVENAQATSAVKLAPGQSWAATTAMAFTTDPLVEFCAGNPDDPECRVYDD